jgi:hypothetical protein
MYEATKLIKELFGNNYNPEESEILQMVTFVMKSGVSLT